MNLLRFFMLLGIICLQQTLFAQLQSPNEFLPHKLGEQFTRHDQLTDYFEYLAANAPKTMKLERYGLTREERPLQIAIFSSEENMKKLRQIKSNNLRLAGMESGTADLQNAPAIVWLSMSVHGNEPSGSECSMELAYRLSRQSDPNIIEWLKNTVVIVDPSLNPDGYSRYTNWYRSVSNKSMNPNPDSREHREPWPGGRPNHYLFDLNRDWAWATQTETRQRLVIYQQWMPHIHADLHEQLTDNPYYFAPAAEPMHDYITPWQRSFQTKIGENHAQYFDKNGWLYFTKEIFDLFYPSYGDTYPMFNGAIGMTYEQAGHSTAGRAIKVATGDTLTLYDRIAHHLTTSLSTIEMGSKNAPAMVKNFQSYFTNASASPQGKYVSFVIKSSNDGNKINAFCQLLDRHRIRYGRAGATQNARGFEYLTGKETQFNVESNDLVISAHQPHATLVQVLLEPESRLADSLTYDITAWSLLHAYGLNAYALQTTLEPQALYEAYKVPENTMQVRPYAWCISRKSLAELQLLGDLLQKGVKVRYATKDFESNNQSFDAGTLVINRADNRTIDANMDAIIKAVAKNRNVQIYPMISGLALRRGADLGSEAYKLIAKPEAAIVYSDDVDDNSYGHTWYYFEEELGYPVSALSLEKINRARLTGITTLIFPNGYYNLTDDQLTTIKDWVKEGGRLIGFDGGARAFADKDGFDLKTKADDTKKDSTALPKPYQQQERAAISDQLPGAVVKSHLDNTHPIGYGFNNDYHTLKTDKYAYEMLKTGNVCWIEDQYKSYGFIGSRVKNRLNKSLVTGVQYMGRGQVVYFVDNPLFRAFWYEGKVMFGNALFF
jgi:hypothetical protein